MRTEENAEAGEKLTAFKEPFLGSNKRIVAWWEGTEESFMCS